jgi:hypothetical protein
MSWIILCSPSSWLASSGLVFSGFGFRKVVVLQLKNSIIGLLLFLGEFRLLRLTLQGEFGSEDLKMGFASVV